MLPTVISFTTSGALGKSALRQANERLVLDAIRRSPGISRAEIARRTGFPRTSVTFVVDRLLKERLVEEQNEGHKNGAQAGRPPTGLELRKNARLAMGVVIAQPKSEIVLMDLAGAIVGRRSIRWQPQVGRFLEELIEAIRGVFGANDRGQMLGMGVSLPGTIDKVAGRVIGAESLGWFNVDIGGVLRRELDWPLFFENDANLSAIAEQWYAPVDGPAMRYFVYVQPQGGLGTGVVVDGRILHGFSSTGAEFGHVMLYADGRPCPCGNQGCWEQYASDAALVRCYGELGGTAKEDAAGIVRRAMAGEDTAVQALRKTAYYLALGFANLVAALNPQDIIIGEPFAAGWDLMKDVVEKEMARRIPAYERVGLRVAPSRVGPDAALKGAAALVLAQFFTQFDHVKDDPLPHGVVMQARR